MNEPFQPQETAFLTYPAGGWRKAMFKWPIQLWRLGLGPLIGRYLMLITHTGRKSGQLRESPLACVPDGDGGWWVVGSNFGREQHPAWTGNLIAEPRASVSFEGRTTAVHANLLTGEQKAEVWPQLTAVWPAYDDYVEASGRNIRVFHLVPA